MKYVVGFAVLVVILVIIYAIVSKAGLNLLSVPVNFGSGSERSVKQESGGKIITETQNQDEELPQSQ